MLAPGWGVFGFTYLYLSYRLFSKYVLSPDSGSGMLLEAGNTE